MIRILFITNARLSFSRGYSINILKTAEALTATRETEVVVLCAAREKEDAKHILENKGIKSFFMLDVEQRRRSMMREIVRRRRTFDILYFRDPFLWYVALVARVLLHKRAVFEVHGSHEWRGGQPFWRLSIAVANGLVFITRSLARYYGSQKPQVVTHTHSFDKQLLENTSSPQELRTQFHLPLAVPLIMYAGSLLWYAWDVLIDMMAHIPAPAMLAIVGAKLEEKDMIRMAAKKAGVEDRIVVYPRVAPTVYPLYLRSADILVNPLRIAYPGSVSSKLFEYLAAGKPVVSTSGEANEEILIHESNALLAELSPRAFADAVNRILQDANLAERLRRNARITARQFTWEKRAEDILLLIRRI